jgi:hypothetical protein
MRPYLAQQALGESWWRMRGGGELQDSSNVQFHLPQLIPLPLLMLWDALFGFALTISEGIIVGLQAIL